MKGFDSTKEQLWDNTSSKISFGENLQISRRKLYEKFYTIASRGGHKKYELWDERGRGGRLVAVIEGQGEGSREEGSLNGESWPLWIPPRVPPFTELDRMKFPQHAHIHWITGVKNSELECRRSYNLVTTNKNRFILIYI